MAWHTDPDTNPNHPVHIDGQGKLKTLSSRLLHFDDQGKCENPINATNVLQLIQMMTWMSHLTVKEKQPQIHLLPLTSATILTLKPRITATGITPNWT